MWWWGLLWAVCACCPPGLAAPPAKGQAVVPCQVGAVRPSALAGSSMGTGDVLWGVAGHIRALREDAHQQSAFN